MTSSVLQNKIVKLVARTDPDNTWSGFTRYQNASAVVGPALC